MIAEIIFITIIYSSLGVCIYCIRKHSENAIKESNRLFKLIN